MSLDHTKASRFGGGRVRTGCLTCVRRRVKCDEGKPYCSRCTKSGRKCEQRQSLVANGELRVIQYGSDPTSTPSPIPWADTDDMRYFDYFRHRTAVELSGFHDTELWSVHVYQIAFQEPVIWHAILALGFAHEQFENGSPTLARSKCSTFGFAQYDKSIRALITGIDTSAFESEDIPLLACVLFCAFESMSYHLHSALSHVHSGSRLMYAPDTMIWIKASRRGYFRLVDPIFAQLDTQRLQLGDSVLSSAVPFWKSLRDNPEARFNMAHARYSLNRILKGLMHKILALKVDCRLSLGVAIDTPGLREAIEAFNAWEDSFDRLVEDLVLCQFCPSALLLQLWRTMINIILHIDLNRGEMGYDDLTTEFETIISLSEMYLRLSAPGSKDMPLETMSQILECSCDNKEGPRLRRCTARVCAENMPSGLLGIHPTLTPLEVPTLREKDAAQSSAASLLQQARHLGQNGDNGGLSNLHSETIKPRFSFSHGIVYPLYITVTRCRVLELRRKAWNILRTCKRREGLWDSDLAAKLGMRIMAIEHGHGHLHSRNRCVCHLSSLDINLEAQRSFIPNEARIRSVKPTFLANRKSIERYYFSWPVTADDKDEIEEVWLEETMTW